MCPSLSCPFTHLTACDRLGLSLLPGFWFILNSLLSCPMTKLAWDLLASICEFYIWHRESGEAILLGMPLGSAAGLWGLPLGWAGGCASRIRQQDVPAGCAWRCQQPRRCPVAVGCAPEGHTLLSPQAWPRSPRHLTRGEPISKPLLFRTMSCKYLTGLLKVLCVCLTEWRQGTSIFWEDFCSARSTEFHIER